MRTHWASVSSPFPGRIRDAPAEYSLQFGSSSSLLLLLSLVANGPLCDLVGLWAAADERKLTPRGVRRTFT